jgi:sugar phosphate isomerase/epimerase
VSRAHPPVWPRHELTYCANVHPGETVAEMLRAIDCIGVVRERRDLEAMGTGLWLSREVSAELSREAGPRHRFVDALHGRGLYLFTLNGFPYGGFHSASVKERVYAPDWTTGERRDYTLELAGLLAECLPEGFDEGTISTLPLGFRHGWTAEHQRRAAGNLCRLASELHRLHEATGRRVRVCLEMEPDGALESTGEMVAFFQNDLPAAADELHIESGLIRDYLGVCFDVCHQSVMFEDVADSLARLRGAGIAIGKIQLSSALEVSNPGEPKVRETLARFAEPRYLHQVRTRCRDGRVVGAADLPMALDDPGWPTEREWRVHFHVPVHLPELCEGFLGTTREAIARMLEVLARTPGPRPHLEVETYTWQVLPRNLRPRNEAELAASLALELAWVEGRMAALGLLAE